MNTIIPLMLVWGGSGRHFLILGMKEEGESVSLNYSFQVGDDFKTPCGEKRLFQYTHMWYIIFVK